VQDEARVGQQPAADGGRLVGGEVVADDVDSEPWFGRVVDLVQEVAEVGGRVLGRELADDLAVGDVQGGEQVGGAVPFVVEAAPLGHSGQHREHRGGALQGLDLGFLVHAEDDRVPRRVEVDADDVADLVDEERVGGDLEGLSAPGLQAEGPPDVLHAGRGDAGLAGEFALGPVRGAFRDFFQGADDNVLDLGVGDRAGDAGAGLVGQPVQAFFQEPAPPAGDRPAVDAQPGRDRDVVPAVSATGSSLVSAMHPAEPSQSPAKSPSDQIVTQNDSRGALETHDRLTRWCRACRRDRV